MNILELKMKLLKRVFVDQKQPRWLRRKAFKAYSILHAQRPPEVVKQMEKERGLA